MFSKRPNRAETLFKGISPSFSPLIQGEFVDRDAAELILASPFRKSLDFPFRNPDHDVFSELFQTFLRTFQTDFSYNLTTRDVASQILDIATGVQLYESLSIFTIDPAFCLLCLSPDGC